MDVAALLFDSDDVLYDDTMWRRWLFQLLTRMGLRTNFHLFFRAWEGEFLQDVFRGQDDFWDALRMFLAEAGLTRGQVEEAVVASKAKRRQILQDIRPFPGVRATTARLRSMDVPLATLTNTPWPAEQAIQMLKTLGLAGRFHPVICSFDCGFAKPAPESYHSALDQLQLPPSAVAFVGHHRDELAGARALGMPTIAVNHDQDAEADMFLDRFDQLLTEVNYQTSRRRAG